MEWSQKVTNRARVGTNRDCAGTNPRRDVSGGPLNTPLATDRPTTTTRSHVNHDRHDGHIQPQRPAHTRAADIGADLLVVPAAQPLRAEVPLATCRCRRIRSR